MAFGWRRRNTNPLEGRFEPKCEEFGVISGSLNELGFADPELARRACHVWANSHRPFSQLLAAQLVVYCEPTDEQVIAKLTSEGDPSTQQLTIARLALAKAFTEPTIQ